MFTNEERILHETTVYVRNLCVDDSSGHDWWHIERVRRMSVILAEQESANVFICQLAALLHDVADRKFNTSLESGLKKVARWLDSQRVTDSDKKHVLEIIGSMSFTSYKQGKQVSSLEGRIVQDADRLDALGAIGIARTMAYSGHTGRLLHHPERSTETAIDHFYDKLLHLKELMNTDYAKQLAQERHLFMETYLQQFYAEWQGER